MYVPKGGAHLLPENKDRRGGRALLFCRRGDWCLEPEPWGPSSGAAVLAHLAGRVTVCLATLDHRWEARGRWDCGHSKALQWVGRANVGCRDSGPGKSSSWELARVRGAGSTFRILVIGTACLRRGGWHGVSAGGVLNRFYSRKV